ncbi:transcriptional adapter 2-beta-like isoform X4 [Centruroides vittatus]|uniref:transcriptional adapter 2-beta-like isoform X4 n=1 Tax=Centruroides vittatus TaxID=120091 RepID=UPI0035106F37
MCFACGAEIGNHKNKHSYQLISVVDSGHDKKPPEESTNCLDCGNVPVFQSPNAWKAKEEMMLLDAVEHYGFGNWEDIAESVNGKTADEVEEHYNNMYILGAIGQATWSCHTKPNIQDHTVLETGLLSPTSPSSSIPEVSSQEQQELGYMPQRDDFEREYDNEAESLVCNLEISNEDEDVDIALKLAQVDMYTRRVRERFRRKRLSRNHGLVSLFFNTCNKQKSTTSKKKPSKDEKEFQDKTRVFCQFQSASEQTQLFENLQKEKESKARIKELMKYRRNGLTKLDECAEFETARYKREKKKENKKKSSNCASIHRRSNVSKKQEDKSGNDISSEEQGENETKEESKEVDASAQPGYNLLSEREKKLCSSLGLKPLYYISFKTILLKDYLDRRQGGTVKTRYPAELDKTHRRKIINFMVNCGWITAC